MTATLLTRFSQETAARLWAEHANRALLSLEDPRFLTLAQHFFMGKELTARATELLGAGWSELKVGAGNARFVLLGRSSQELRFIFSFDEQSALLTADTAELRLNPDQLATLL